jgi:hypothetical protein
MNCTKKYQNNKVTNDNGIPKPIIMLLKRGFKPWEAAKIQAVIIGAMAASMIAT